MNLKKILKSLPIESYVLVIIPIFLIIFSWLIKSPGFNFSGNWFKDLLSYIYVGGEFLIYLLVVLNLFIFQKILFLFFMGLLEKRDKKSFRDSLARVFPILKHHFYFLLVVITSSLFSGIFLGYLYSSSARNYIVNTTRTITRWDYNFFGGYSFLKVGGFIKGLGAFPAQSIIFCYDTLSLVLPAVILIFIISNKKIAKKFIIFSFLIGFLSFPIWFRLPVVTPYEMYVMNSLKLPQPASIENNISSYKASPGLDGFWQEYETAKKTSRGSFSLSLTGFPSMHAGWGAGMVFYGTELWPPLGVVLFIWFILEILGAVFIGIHYGIDIVLGVIMAAITILLVEFLLSVEKKYYSGGESFVLVDIIQKDFKTAIGAFKKNFLKIKEIIFKKNHPD